MKKSLHLRIWRQESNTSIGKFEEYHMSDISFDLSLLELLDKLNEELIVNGERPVYFEHDCRE